MKVKVRERKQWKWKENCWSCLFLLTGLLQITFPTAHSISIKMKVPQAMKVKGYNGCNVILISEFWRCLMFNCLILLLLGVTSQRISRERHYGQNQNWIAVTVNLYLILQSNHLNNCRPLTDLQTLKKRNNQDLGGLPASKPHLETKSIFFDLERYISYMSYHFLKDLCRLPVSSKRATSRDQRFFNLERIYPIILYVLSFPKIPMPTASIQ